MCVNGFGGSLTAEITTFRVSVDARGEQEVLDQGDDLDLTHVVEEFVEFFLTLHVQDHVGAEHENGRSQDGEDLETFKPDNSIVDQVKLINLELTHEAVENPGEGGSERLDSQLTQMIAHIRFIHL